MTKTYVCGCLCTKTCWIWIMIGFIIISIILSIVFAVLVGVNVEAKRDMGDDLHYTNYYKYALYRVETTNKKLSGVVILNNDAYENEFVCSLNNLSNEKNSTYGGRKIDAFVVVVKKNKCYMYISSGGDVKSAKNQKDIDITAMFDLCLENKCNPHKYIRFLGEFENISKQVDGYYTYINKMIIVSSVLLPVFVCLVCVFWAFALCLSGNCS